MIRSWRRTATALVVALTAETAAAGQTSPLTDVQSLSQTYRRILNADFAGATHALGTCRAPQPACRVVATTALWWQIQLDPGSTARDAAFLKAVEDTIRVTEAWTAREPRSAEAWFYLGAAYALRVQWRVLREERLAAARDGKRIKDALDQSIALNPNLDDAFFGLGLYQYYAAVAPMAARMLRWLLFLPGGDKVRGLEQMVRARTSGVLLRGEADYQLALIYLWYEHQPQRALELLGGLQASYPRNPLFYKEIAEVHDTYLHDPFASLAAYTGLLAAADQGRMHAIPIARFEARLGMARQLDALHETDRAAETLRVFVEQRPTEPHTALARALVALGDAEDRLGHRDRAMSAYKLAIAETPAHDPFDVRSRATLGLRRRLDRDKTEAYRLSLEGWRLAETGALSAAEGALTRSLQLNPADPVARHRYGYVLARDGRDRAALREFEQVLAVKVNTPPFIVAATYLEVGRTHQRAGDRARAIEMFKRSIAVYGGGADTRAAATAALAQLQPLSSPVRDVQRD